jgi:histidyl-tRNA synthetase
MFLNIPINPLRILDSKNPALAELIAGAPLLSDYLDTESAEHFEQVKQLLGDIGVEFVLNPRLVRGLDYYSRTVFEWVTDQLGAQGAVCSGGRYDGLIEQLGGRATPASGWALGFERVVELLEAQAGRVPAPVLDAYLVTVGDRARRRGFAIAEALRTQVPALRLAMDCTGGGFKAQLKRADRSGARLALIVGEDEVGSGNVGLKPLRTEQPQTTVTVDDLVGELRRDAGRPG